MVSRKVLKGYLIGPVNKVLRFKYAQMGGILLNEWKLPPRISTDATLYKETLKILELTHDFMNNVKNLTHAKAEEATDLFF
jgi:hypothetical protein